MRRIRPIRTLALPLLAALVAACGDGGTGPVRDSGVYVLAGGSATDTVDAALPNLQVEVVGQGGKPAAGVSISFVGPESNALLMSFAEGSTFTRAVTTTTDGAGRAAVRMRMGTASGEATLAIRVPDLGLEQTVRFTVLPGAPFRLALGPRDTAVYTGVAVPLRVTLADRHGNALAQPPQLAATAPLALQGASVSAAAHGRGRVTVAFGALADTVWVSVVPQGTVAAVRGGELVLFNLDGAGLRTLAGDVQVPEGGDPAWAPDAQSLAATLGFARRLHRVPLQGAPVPLLPAGDPGLHGGPAYSADGAWIYYSANGCGIMRVPAAGGVAEAVPTGPGCAADPAPSPDGRTLVFARVPFGASPSIHALDLESGAVTLLRPSGRGPRWSPDGERIAFVDASVMVMEPDGSTPLPAGSVPANAASPLLRPSVSWSPDGAWLVVHGATAPGAATPGLYVVRVADGLTLPLPFATGFRKPAWRP